MRSDFNVIQDYQRHLRGMELASSTIDEYARIVGSMENWLREEYSVDFSDLDSIKGYMISMYCTSIQPLKITSRTLYLTIIKAFLKWIYAMQYVQHDLSAAVTKLPTIDKYNAAHPEETSPKRGYTVEEVAAMLTCPRRSKFVTHRDRAIIATMLATGLRVSELASLRVSDVLDEPQLVYVPRKGSHGQKLPVSIAPNAYPYIRQYLKIRSANNTVSPEEALWVSNRGKELTRMEIWNTLSCLQKKIGIPTGTHTLRHTMITEVTKNSNPIVARDAAGQKSITVTNRYLHSTQQEVQQAVDLAGSLIENARSLAEFLD